MNTNIFSVMYLILGVGCDRLLAEICPPDWHQYGASCYFVTEKMDWYKAESVCAELGAKLGIPNSQSEQDFIWEFFLQKINDKPTPDLWIGFINTKGNWNERLSTDPCGPYENWAEEQPDSSQWSGQYQFCTAMWAGPNGKWDDQPWDDKQHAVCELPVTNTPVFRLTPQCLLHHAMDEFLGKVLCRAGSLAHHIPGVAPSFYCKMEGR